MNMMTKETDIYSVVVLSVKAACFENEEKLSMNTFFELAESRYSVRKFEEREIEEDQLERILRAGQIAPTGANRQPQRIFVLQSPEAIEKVRSLTRYAFNAPTVLLICADFDDAWTGVDGHNCAVTDAVIVITHMMLAAWDEGIGSCWVRGFEKNITHTSQPNSYVKH